MEMAKTAKITPLVKNLCIAAMRKSQTAMYYALGDPDYIGKRVRMAVEVGKPVEDPLLKALASLEKTVQTLALRMPQMEAIDALNIVGDIVQVSKSFIDHYFGFEPGKA